VSQHSVAKKKIFYENLFQQIEENYRDACLLMDQVNKRGDFRWNFLVHSISVTLIRDHTKKNVVGLRSYASFFFSLADEII
jgi:hypothetical protein